MFVGNQPEYRDIVEPASRPVLLLTDDYGTASDTPYLPFVAVITKFSVSGNGSLNVQTEVNVAAEYRLSSSTGDALEMHDGSP